MPPRLRLLIAKCLLHTCRFLVVFTMVMLLIGFNVVARWSIEKTKALQAKCQSLLMRTEADLMTRKAV